MEVHSTGCQLTELGKYYWRLVMKEESNMKYFSEAYFRNIAYSTPLYEQRTYSDNLQGASLYKQFDIFLSYNISDLNVVKVYITLCRKWGYKYILTALLMLT